MTYDKKLEKARAKSEKKAVKAEIKQKKRTAVDDAEDSASAPSIAIRYAEIVRGCLYVLTGISIMVAIFLGQRGAVVSLNDVIDNLFAATTGKIILVMIGLAMLLYGFKHLRIIK